MESISNNKSSSIVVVGDLHIPFHNPDALELFFKFIKDIQPKKIIINGDLMDCWEISDFNKSPFVIDGDFRNEIERTKSFFERLKHFCPDSKIEWIYGNHEFRMQKYLYTRAMELSFLEVLELDNLLGIRGVEVIKPNKYLGKFSHNWVKEGSFYIGHWDRINKWGYTAKNLVDSFGVNIIQSHTHRISSHSRTFIDRQIRSYEIGCLCLPSYLNNPDWQLGWGIIEKVGEIESFYQIQIINNAFFYKNKLYKYD